MLNSDGFMPNWGAEYKGWENWTISWCTYLGNGARYGHGCNRSRI